MIENASILFANIIICILYLLPHFIAYSVFSAYLSLPVIRPLCRFLEQLAHTLWCPYWAARWGISIHAGETAAGQPTGNCRSGVVRRTSGASNSAKNCINPMGTASDPHRKGPRKHGRDDDDKAPPSKTVKLDTGQPASQFACPFYLHSRHEWHNCLRNYTLHRIVDVRLHLLRVHLLAPQCPSCGREFKGDSAEDHCNTHIQLRNCQRLPLPLPARHGVTGDQLEAMRAIATRRTGRRGQDTAAAKWFEMWDIIFPDTTRPASPYITEHPDVQRINDMNQFILTNERWPEDIISTSASSPILLDMPRNALVATMEGLLASYRRIYRGLNRSSTPEVLADTVPVTPVTSLPSTALQPSPDLELLSANTQPVQASEGPLLPPGHQATTAADPSQWTLQPPNATFSLSGSSHNNNPVAQRTHSTSPLASDPYSFTDTQIQESDVNFQDIDDFIETHGSITQFINNYGSNSSDFWSNFDADAADEA